MHATPFLAAYVTVQIERLGRTLQAAENLKEATQREAADAASTVEKELVRYASTQRSKKQGVVHESM